MLNDVMSRRFLINTVAAGATAVIAYPVWQSMSDNCPTDQPLDARTTCVYYPSSHGNQYYCESLNNEALICLESCVSSTTGSLLTVFKHYASQSSRWLSSTFFQEASQNSLPIVTQCLKQVFHQSQVKPVRDYENFMTAVRF